MAKKKNAVPEPVSDGDWKVRDDADRIKRYAELAMDGKRYAAARKHVAAEHDALVKITGIGGGMKARPLARQGRRKSTRVLRSGGGR